MRLQAVALTTLLSGYTPTLLAHPGPHAGFADSSALMHVLSHAWAVPGAFLLIGMLFVALKYLPRIK